MEATHIITWKNLKGLGMTETTNYNRNYNVAADSTNPIKVSLLGVNPKNKRVSWVSIVDPADFERLHDLLDRKMTEEDKKVNKFAVYKFQLTKI